MAALCYLSGYLGVFVLLPIEIVIRRRGLRGTSYALVALFGAILIARLVQGRLLLQEIVVVGMLVGGLVALHLSPVTINRYLPKLSAFLSPKIIRLLVCTVVWSLIATPFTLRVVADGEFVASLQRDAVALSDDLNIAPAERDQINSLIERVVRFVVASYTPLYFLIVAFTWYLGNAIGKRFPNYRRYPFERFRAPSQLLWPTVIGYAVLLIGTRFEWGTWIYVVWNVALTLSLCYLLQGIAIILFHIRRRSSKPSAENWLTAIFIGATLLPIVNLIVYIGTTLIGLVESWVNLGRDDRQGG